MSMFNRLRTASVAVAALTASVDAAASDQYYAVLWNRNVPTADAANGAQIKLQTNVLHQTCTPISKNFVRHELWYGLQSGRVTWIEAGVMDGSDTYSGGCQVQRIFWADNRSNGGGFNEHISPNGWALGDVNYVIIMRNTNSCTWQVYFGGNLIGTSTNNCPGTGRYVAAGIETSSQTSGSVVGFLSGWDMINSSFTYNGGWDGATLAQFVGSTGASSGNPRIKMVTGGTEEVLNENW